MKLIIDQLIATTFWEWIGFLFGILQVFFAIKNKVINFVFGLVGAIVYIYLFAIGGLYAEASLNIYYGIISIVGILLWKNNRIQRAENQIQKANAKDWRIAIAITIGSFLICYFALKNYTNSTVPIWDGMVAAFAWSGSWLLTKRKLETWILLNISNALAIPLQIQKGYMLTSVLTAILFVFAIFGYWQWRQIIRRNLKEIE
jgi:nicotinamide mononucleotide transporter